MKCPVCKVEMFIDSTTIDDEKSTETFIYKCPNKQCNNYGYKDVKEE
jgi:hypothetical protein